jgi:hypothetical protein
MKQHYWADLDLRTLANEDNITGLWEKQGSVGCFFGVFWVSSNTGSIMEETSSRSRRR